MKKVKACIECSFCPNILEYWSEVYLGEHWVDKYSYDECKSEKEYKLEFSPPSWSDLDNSEWDVNSEGYICPNCKSEKRKK